MPSLRDIGSFIINPGDAIESALRSYTGDTFFPMERHLRSRNDQIMRQIPQALQRPTLASMGQRYQNYPAATFDERFGPYNVGPMSDPALLRQFLQPRSFPPSEMVIPGSPSWPAGFIRSEAPTMMQLADARRPARPVLSEQQKAIGADLLNPKNWEAFMAAMRERDRKKAAEQPQAIEY